MFDGMYNSEIKKRFFEEVCSHLNDVQRQNYVDIFLRVGGIESQFGKDLYDFSYSDFVYLFEVEMWTRANTFKNKKSIVGNYLVWAHQTGFISAQPLFVYRNLKLKDLTGNYLFLRAYFKDFEDLVTSYEEVTVDTKIFGADCLVYLLWIYDGDSEDIRDIKINDVDLSTKTIQIGGRLFDMPDALVKAVARSMGKQYTFSPSVTPDTYLLRGKQHERLPDSAYSNKLGLLSGLAKKQLGARKGEFSAQKIQRSAKFARVYEEETRTGVKTQVISEKDIVISPSIGEVFNEDNSTALRNLANDYCKWRSVYYGG